MSSVLDPHDRERCLLDVEQVLARPGALHERLEATAALLGDRLGAQRVVLYGDMLPGETAVRVRVEWTAPDRRRLDRVVDTVPMLTSAALEHELVASAPRGTACPADCPTSAPHCALRGACSTVLEPLRLGGVQFGALAVHDVTGVEWSPAHVSLVANVARRVALEIAHVRQQHLVEQLQAQRAGIAATVLHQVGTPVAVIEGVVEHLRDHPEMLDGLLDIASVELRRLHRLCEDLTSIVDGAAASAERGEGHCDVAVTVARCARDARALHDPGCTFELTIDDPLPAVACHSGDLERMLRRVLDNAARYAGDRARVDVSCWSDETHVFVSVRDDGVGLTVAESQVLGEPFSRLDPEMRRQPGGHGLGLALGRQLARRAGGDLRIEPRGDGPGAQVTIVLPAAHRPW